MPSTTDSRLHDELQLLLAMYPTELDFSDRLSHLNFSNGSGSFTLSIGEGYPSTQRPTVIMAHTRKRRKDVREMLRQTIAEMATGEEMLDLIITTFLEITTSEAALSVPDPIKNFQTQQSPQIRAPDLTIIIWLHHLLNTNKRKQVLHPSSSSVSGLSKPGYPGVLVFSGPQTAVRGHVTELKNLNWQAFQVRLEEPTEWAFAHGGGVREVESMSDIVLKIGEVNKTNFMQAMHMK